MTTKNYNIVFMGTPHFAVPALRMLLQLPYVRVVGVVTQPDRPAGRGQTLTASPVKQCAQEHGIPVFAFTKMKDPLTAQTLANLKPHLMVVAAYGRILPPSLLSIPPHGCINIHASLLPLYRGASPINHALLHGQSKTGVSLMHMEEGLDTGAVYAQAELPIEPNDTCESLTPKLANLGASLLESHLLPILQQTCIALPQQHSQATHAPILQKADGELLFHKTAQELEQQVRAFYPWPGTFFHFFGNRVQVLECKIIQHLNLQPGLFQLLPHQGIAVGSGKQTTLLITRIKPAGKQTMLAYDWAKNISMKPSSS